VGDGLQVLSYTAKVESLCEYQLGRLGCPKGSASYSAAESAHLPGMHMGSHGNEMLNQGSYATDV